MSDEKTLPTLNDDDIVEVVIDRRSSLRLIGGSVLGAMVMAVPRSARAQADGDATGCHDNGGDNASCGRSRPGCSDSDPSDAQGHGRNCGGGGGGGGGRGGGCSDSDPNDQVGRGRNCGRGGRGRGGERVR